MDGMDVFAEVEEFCENDTLDIPTPLHAKDTGVDAISSESDAEAFFTNTKKVKAVKSRSNKAKKKSPQKGDAGDPTVVNNENSSEFNANTAVVRGSTEKTRRTRQKRNQNADLVENYMQKQTSATLELEQLSQPKHNQRGRARRRYIRNKASNVTATIDLAGPKTPPLPPRISSGKNVIVINSGDEDDNISYTNCPAGTPDSSFDIENEEIQVKVKWTDQIEVVPLRRHQKFADLFNELSKRKGVNPKDIVLNLNEKIITPDDTPASINYTIVRFISGRIVDTPDYFVPMKKKDPNLLKIKIQSNAFKKPLQVKMNKDQHFKILYIKCSEELKIPCNSIKLSFDGDLLNVNETPNDLEFEGGEVVDCRLKQ